MEKFVKIEHTADIGVRAYGKTQEELFANAATGMISLLFGENAPEASSEITVEIRGEDPEELLVNFLEEILYQMNVNKFASSEAAVIQPGDNYLTMRMKGEPLDKTRHNIHYDIKGVTFHQLKIEKIKRILTVQVIFDI